MPDVGLILRNILLGLVAATLIASSNYVLNELLDAPFDRLHPVKRHRPAARGLIVPAAGYAQWLLMMLAGLAVANLVSRPLTFVCAGLWAAGCAYNIPPARTKDLPYLDVLFESLNNPLRLLLGWYTVTSSLIPPLTLLLAYWMIGAYFMALKRLSEYREIGFAVANAYRRSFFYYSEASLLVSTIFYASASMLFFGAFLMRYRIELICSFPFLAITMAVYFHLALQRESAVQHPEKLYRQPVLMISVLAYVLVSLCLLWVRIPFLNSFFTPTLPRH